MTRPRDRVDVETRLTPEMIAETPERATVEALRAVLDLTCLALIAANPALLHDGWPSMPAHGYLAGVRVADRILKHGHALRRELVRYAHHLDRQRERATERLEDELPF